MDLMIKNEHVLDLLNESNRAAGFTAKEEQAYPEKLDAVQRAEYVLSGYVADMLRNSIEVHRELDLSYGTVGNLPAVLGLRFREIREMKDTWQDSAASLAKSLAAYLFFLAMNEHGCALKVVQMGTPFAPPPKSEEPLWGDLFRYKTGVRREVDCHIDHAVLAQIHTGSGTVDPDDRRHREGHQRIARQRELLHALHHRRLALES